MRRRDEVLVGILVTIALAIGITGTLWLARRGFGSTYPLHARFTWGAGLKNGQPVLLAGLHVGTVSEIEFNQSGWLDVTMDIEEKRRIPEGTTATVAQLSLFGDKAIALTPTTPSTTMIAPGDTVPVGKATPTLDDMMFRVDSLMRGVSDVTEKIEFEFVEGGGIADMRRTMASANRLVNQLSNVAAVQSRNLTLTMASVRQTLGSVDSSVVDSTLRNMRTTSENMTVLTGNLKGTMQRLDSVAAQLENGNGSAGKLLNDPALYDNARALMARMDSLMADLKRNPKKYINLKIF
ncbi:MAG: MlaD family protein [Gemmatimonadota bacterium]|nr:MlaD family protein [Gemmatimonadota bacterium]